MEITGHNLRREFAKLHPDVRRYLQDIILVHKIPDAYLIAETLDGLDAPPPPPRPKSAIVYATKPKRRTGDSR